jgi:hypothetical protein
MRTQETAAVQETPLCFLTTATMADTTAVVNPWLWAGESEEEADEEEAVSGQLRSRVSS